MTVDTTQHPRQYLVLLAILTTVAFLAGCRSSPSFYQSRPNLDQSKLSNIEVCGAAITPTTSGHTWDSLPAMQNRVLEAKRRGLNVSNCVDLVRNGKNKAATHQSNTATRIVPNPPANQSDQYVCTLALSSAGYWERGAHYQDWVREAQRRNISEDDCRQTLNHKTRLASSNIIKATSQSNSNSFSLVSDKTLCSIAVTSPTKPLAWEVTSQWRSYTEMAKRRGLTLKSCAILLGRTWFGDGQDEAALNSKSQLATGNPPSISSITNKNAVAVIIGNRNYKGRIPKVDYAKNDADAFMKFVTGRLGYDPENIIDLRDATKAELETAFGNTITHEGKLWRYLHPKGKSDITVYYSGHGVPGLKDRRSYLLPVDADPESPEINGYSLDTLFGNLGKLKARSVTVYLDACFSGDSSGGALTRSASGITIKARLPKAGKGMTVITAAQSDQLASWDHKAKHGLFTRHLLDALQGAADIGEYGNKDGQINIAETRAYLDEHLTRQARRDYGRVQNAWIKGGNKTVLATTE